ncbi:UNVERIFIED_CONTAM: Calmodulin-binding transcription activator 3, partial [Sesamum radiatum]
KMRRMRTENAHILLDYEVMVSKVVKDNEENEEGNVHILQDFEVMVSKVLKMKSGGQSVLHFAAGLGYNWAIPPTIAARVSANFRDADGCTALSRKHSHTEAPEALIDTTPTYPAGRPPAELAANNGHKGISGYLSDSLLSSLSSHISLLNLEDSNEGNDRGKAVETVTGRIATPAGYGDLPHGDFPQVCIC